jgi:uncharacterized membrane protein
VSGIGQTTGAHRRKAGAHVTPRAVNILNVISSASLIALITLCVAWELWLAPQRSGGSWLVLKVLPLLAPLFGILRGKRYTHRWMTLLVIAYFVEGVVRAYSDSGLSARLACVEIALALILFISAILYVRKSK